MAEVKLKLADEAATVKLGERLSELLVPLCRTRAQAINILLYGELGAGKTTFSRGFIQRYYQGLVKSPTYTLVEPYACGDFALYHFDLYRLSDPEEFEYLGVRDYFAQPGCCLIEWPDKAGEFLPEADVILEFSYAHVARQVVLKSNLLSQQQLNELSELSDML
ncbi:MAG: tRNA (adenosine(37)-N6)-threonylcarbamoyltransferase complex ATPase subunit type 1 TsaE [Succinivibrio sp.]|nr:tRNA (adenosine(37)-N6)-threonylcarbamoyltransferase complex ATPase subunit type 1 TsaE [Succinivibrio sp.]